MFLEEEKKIRCLVEEIINNQVFECLLQVERGATLLKRGCKNEHKRDVTSTYSTSRGGQSGTHSCVWRGGGEVDSWQNIFTLSGERCARRLGGGGDSGEVDTQFSHHS